PTWRKTALCIGTLVFGVALLLATPSISQAGRFLFFVSRQTQLDGFVRDILAYGRIREMSDGQRYFKQLNGELITYDPSKVTISRDAGTRPIVALDQILERDHIDPVRYAEFRQRLIDLKLIEFEVEDGYVAFLYDGILDNLMGFLYVREGAAPPALDSELFACKLVALRRIRGNWYAFGTT